MHPAYIVSVLSGPARRATQAVDWRRLETGLGCVLLADLLWGLLPLFWKQMDGMPPGELMAHRLLWSGVTAAGLLTVTRGWSDWCKLWRSPQQVLLGGLAGLMLSTNWLVYVWAVQAGRILECSLGYFLVPLLTIALGRGCFREAVRPRQAVAILLAVVGVLVPVILSPHPLWVGAALAGTFCAYSFLKKCSPGSAISGLALETSLLCPLALVYLFYQHYWAGGTVLLGPAGAAWWPWVMASGVVTVLPLWLFSAGAKKVRFITLGLLQYVTPSCQFLLGWWVYAEPLSLTHGVAFGFIWAGLGWYVYDVIRQQRAAG